MEIPLIFQENSTHVFRCRRLLFSTRGVLFLKEIPSLFLMPTSHIISPGGMVDPFFGGWNLFWRQPCIWTLASHKSSRFGHLESYMFVPAGLATCFNGATRRYLELCALPKHLRKKERLRTTSTTLKKSLKLWCFKKNTLKLRKFHKLPLLPQKTDNNYQHISLFELSHWKHAVPGFCWGAFLRGCNKIIDP